MPDVRECNIKAPHEGHTWTEAAPKMMKYHYCQGKIWNAFEVRTHLTELIQTALEYQDRPGYVSGEPAPHIKIMEELWPKVVGFVQPEDMPLKVVYNLDASSQEWNYQPGQLMVVPPSPHERIADALEKLNGVVDNLSKNVSSLKREVRTSRVSQRKSY